MEVDKAVKLIGVYGKQLKGVAERLEALSPELVATNPLCEEIFYAEMVFAQKLVVELTKLTIGDERETPDHKDPDENEDSAFMPGELNDVMNGEDNERSSGIEESHKI